MPEPRVQLRDVQDADLAVFFEHQLDPAANHMAAFTRKNPADRESFDAHWIKIRNNPEITVKTILFDERVVGHIASYGPSSEKEITYWLGREHWGKGIATAALALFLGEVPLRPLFARAAKDNLASIRVLAKCSFAICGNDRNFANARGAEIDEVILQVQ